MVKRTNGEEFNYGQQRGRFCCCLLLHCILKSAVLKHLGWEGTVPWRVFAQHFTPMTHQGAPKEPPRYSEGGMDTQ